MAMYHYTLTLSSPEGGILAGSGKDVGRIWEGFAKDLGRRAAMILPVLQMKCGTSPVFVDYVNLTQGGIKMTTVMCIVEVEDGERWANAWKKGTPGNRHEGLFAEVGRVRTYRDPENHNFVGTFFEVEDMEKFRALMGSDEARKAGAEDGLKADTLRILVEFTP
jgi:hypothetical protein